MSVYKILVVGPSWIGDMVMAQSLFITLKKENPDCIIDVVAPQWSVPLLARMPEVNSAISLSAKHKQLALFYRYKIGRSLRKNDYDEAIVIPRSFKSALVPFFAGIPKRTGYKGEMRYGVLNNIFPLDKKVLKQTVQRYVYLGSELKTTASPITPYPQLQINLRNRDELVTKYHLSLDKPVIGLMPGAEYGPAKKWPYFKELAELLVKQNITVWIFGSDKDSLTGEEISGGNEQIVNLCGKTQLVDVIDLISLCKKIISNDSGLMHVAAAVNVPIVAIYGSSTPDYTPPLTSKANIHYLGLDCSPCFKRECPLAHTHCLSEIKAQDVFESALK